MRNIVTSLLLVCVLLVPIVSCLGCAARPANIGQHYRIAKVGVSDFMLPPDLSKKWDAVLETSVSLGRLGRNQRKGQGTKCSIHSRWFSLYPEAHSSDWIARVPTPIAWNDKDLRLNIQTDWTRFLARIDDLKVRGCLTPRGRERARLWIAESLAVPVRTTSFFRDPLSEYGFVILRPGMKLFIERSVFRTGGTDTITNYLGETKVYYTVVRERSGRVGLKLSAAKRSKGLSSRISKEFPDVKLASTFQGMRELRFFSLTFYVPTHRKRNAILIGVRDFHEMADVSHRVEKDPLIPCRNLASVGVACVSFEGNVSASAQVEIWVNGKEESFPVGTSLNTFVKSYPPGEWAEIWNTLRLTRLFRGKLHGVEYSRSDPEARLVVLLAGDRITWGQASNSR